MGTLLEIEGFIAQLADRYTRRADVLARGFSGYTTRDALQIIRKAVLDEKPDCVIMAFGANDSVLPGQIQHVPLEEYRENIETMASQIACIGAWLVLVTPPPVHELKTKSRTMEHTETYALSCYEAGLEMNVPVVDLFHVIQEQPEWETECMMDGIHLTRRGMELFYGELKKTLERLMPLAQMQRLEVNGI
jgi:lysophospholipase L1-like esterase